MLNAAPVLEPPRRDARLPRLDVDGPAGHVERHMKFRDIR